jgi:hypothetical protein
MYLYPYGTIFSVQNKTMALGKSPTFLIFYLPKAGSMMNFQGIENDEQRTLPFWYIPLRWGNTVDL